eukprot:1147285-Pelagomonas_calceolata.AAC.1
MPEHRFVHPMMKICWDIAAALCCSKFTMQTRNEKKNYVGKGNSPSSTKGNTLAQKSLESPPPRSYKKKILVGICRVVGSTRLHNLEARSILIVLEEGLNADPMHLELRQALEHAIRHQQAQIAQATQQQQQQTQEWSHEGKGADNVDAACFSRKSNINDGSTAAKVPFEGRSVEERGDEACVWDGEDVEGIEVHHLKVQLQNQRDQHLIVGASSNDAEAKQMMQTMQTGMTRLIGFRVSCKYSGTLSGCQCPAVRNMAVQPVWLSMTCTSTEQVSNRAIPPHLFDPSIPDKARRTSSRLDAIL